VGGSEVCKCWVVVIAMMELKLPNRRWVLVLGGSGLADGGTQTAK
jgi:hypothetical protein